MIVTFLTDFGLSDPYVGVMKGVVLRYRPQAQLIDLTHLVSPQNVLEGAFQLARAVPHFPKGTIHLAVVDPGVGGDRRAVAVKTADAWFVGPDNGLFSLAIPTPSQAEAIFELETPEDASATFHGRDVFAHAAGKIANGETNPGASSQKPLQRLQIPFQSTRKTQEVVIAVVDHFGNCITALHRSSGMHPQSLHGVPFRRTYSEAAPGEPLCLWGSDGYLELAVNGGSAARRFGLKAGDQLRVSSAASPDAP